jgi:hypothetical protein
MHLRILLLFLLLLTGNTSCVGPVTTQDDVDPPGWAYDSIQFEISPVTSAALPDNTALEWFRDQLHIYRICDRAHVTFIVQQVDDRPGPPLWDLGSLTAYTSRRRTLYDHDFDDRRLRVFVLYLKGIYLESYGPRILGGIQFQESVFAIFTDGSGDREPSVLLHEFGHTIGIAEEQSHGNVDRAHTSHCANGRCVMYWSTPERFSSFDGYCLAYIRDWIKERNRAKLY